MARHKNKNKIQKGSSTTQNQLSGQSVLNTDKDPFMCGNFENNNKERESQKMDISQTLRESANISMNGASCNEISMKTQTNNELTLHMSMTLKDEQTMDTNMKDPMSITVLSLCLRVSFFVFTFCPFCILFYFLFFLFFTFFWFQKI